MAIELKKSGWMQLFSDLRAPSMFLSRFFKIRPGNIYNGSKINLDIQRYGEDVAVAIRRMTGPNLNDFGDFTSKEFEPPSYGEAFPLNINDLVNRMAGVDPYSAAYEEYASAIVSTMARGFVHIDHKITRAVELQASQILQTGILTLVDKDGNTVYTLDFKPKATHFPTVATSWSSGSSTPLDDIKALAEVIRADGKVDPDTLILGGTAARNLLKNTDVKAVLDNTRYNVGEINPGASNSGATRQGRIWVGDYEFTLYTYPETYTNPQTGAVTKYVTADKAIMLSSRTRLDFTAAKVPAALQDPRVANLLPGRMTSSEGGFDVTPNVYTTPNGKEIMGELEARPLLIPTQIDGFGCLDTEA